MNWKNFAHVGKPISMLQARLSIAKFRNAYPKLASLHKKLSEEFKEIDYDRK